MYKWRQKFMTMHTRTAKRPKKLRFNITLTSDANRALKGMAQVERRSKSNMLEILIRKESGRFDASEKSAA